MAYLKLELAIGEAISLDHENVGFGAPETRQISLPVSPRRLADLNSIGDWSNSGLSVEIVVD